MRSIIKMLGLAFFATLAFSAVGAIGAGSASALLFLTTGASEELFTVVNLNTAAKPALLETKNGTKVECESVLGHGIILNKTDRVDKLLFTFHKCKTGSNVCTSNDEPSGSGLIKTLELDALLVTLLNPPDKYGILVLAERGNLADFICGIVQIRVKGTVVGEFTEGLGESEKGAKEMKVSFKKGGTGEPAIKCYWTLQGTAAPKLEATNLLGTFEESSEEAEGDVSAANVVQLTHK